MTITRQKRLSESRRYLTKLLVVASMIKHNIPTDIIDIGPTSQSEREEAENLAKHGSVHIPELLVNIHNLAHFDKYVAGWSRLSIETGILEIVRVGEGNSIVVGLPNDREITCVVLESEVANQFQRLQRANSPSHFGG
ncbi:MAG: hypothetical protein LUP95_03615 [Euryarchaeota archaeon]|nr:hypothetical protein [Euryarchaeota archaeon]